MPRDVSREQRRQIVNAYGRRTHSAPVRTEERVVQRSRPEPLLARTTRWVLRHRGYVLAAWLVLLIGGWIRI